MGMVSRVWHPICLLNTKWTTNFLHKRLVQVTFGSRPCVLHVQWKHLLRSPSSRWEERWWLRCGNQCCNQSENLRSCKEWLRRYTIVVLSSPSNINSNRIASLANSNVVKLTNQTPARISDITIASQQPWTEYTRHGPLRVCGSCQSLDQKQLDKGINYPFISRERSQSAVWCQGRQGTLILKMAGGRMS